MPSDNAASRVAETYELLHLIFKNAQHDFGDSSLVPVAQANRFVGSVALDVLWETQKSLLPLFRVIDHCFEIEIEERCVWNPVYGNWDDDSADEQRVMHLKPGQHRGISAKDRERLKFYASRIKAIIDTPVKGESVGDLHIFSEDLPNVILADGNSILLPNLRRLEIGPRLTSFFEHIGFRVEPDEEDPEVPYIALYRFTEHLGDLCRADSLRTLGIQIDNNLAMLPAIRALPVLEELHLTFMKVETNPDLRALQLSDPEDDEDAEGLVGRKLKATAEPGFPALKALRLTDPLNLKSARIVLETLVPDRLKLKSLHIRGWKHAYDDSLVARKLYRAIRVRCDRTALTHITVVTGRYDRNPPSPLELLCDLMLLPNITHACIDIFDNYLDVNGVLDRLTHAWKRLESLTLFNQPQEEWKTQPRVHTENSLASLACLAHRCPHLSYLSLQLNLDTVPQPVTPDPLHAPLLDRRVVLNVGTHSNQTATKKEIVVQLAAYLTSIFPIPTLTSVTYDFEGEALTWDDVKNLPRVPTPTLAMYDDPCGASRRQWLSSGDIRVMLGHDKKVQKAAKRNKGAPASESAMPPADKNLKKPAATKKKSAANAVNTTAVAQTTTKATAETANVPAACASSERPLPALVAPTTGAAPAHNSRKKRQLAFPSIAVGSAFQVTCFQDVGGHHLRSKRSTPAGSAPQGHPAKRQRITAAPPTGTPAKAPAKTEKSGRQTRSSKSTKKQAGGRRTKA